MTRTAMGDIFKRLNISDFEFASDEEVFTI